MNKEEFKPVILGADIGAYSIARTIYEHYNIKSIIVCKALSWMMYYSRICENIVIDNMTEKKLIKALINIGKKKKKTKLLIFGCSEDYVEIISRNKELLSKYYIVPYIDKKIFEKVVEKKNFYKVCKKLKINYPRTLIINNKNYKNIKVPFSYPVVLKTSDRAQYTRCYFEGKRKIYIIKDIKELRNTLNLIYHSTYKGEFILQEYIVGEDTNMRVLTCFCNENSDVVFSRIGQVLLEEKGPNATGNYTAIINTLDDNIVQDATKFLKATKYVGYANFDIKYNDINNEYYFFELNVRLGRSNFYMSNGNTNYLEPLVDTYIRNSEYKNSEIRGDELYSVVPFEIINHYVKDKSLVKEAVSLKKNHPLFYPKDMNFKRRLYIILAKINWIKKYWSNYGK